MVRVPALISPPYEGGARGGLMIIYILIQAGIFVNYPI